MTPDEELTAYFQTVLNPEVHASAQVMQAIANAGHIGTTTHAPGDPYETAFREGKRALALFILGRAGVSVMPGGSDDR